METKRSRKYVHDMIISILEANLKLKTNETEHLFSECINKIPVEELVKLPKSLIRVKTIKESSELLKSKSLKCH